MPSETTENVSLYRKLGKDEAPPYDLEKLAPDARLFTKPTLLCCGGIFINHHKQEFEQQANGFAKIGHALLGFKESINPADPLDIVSVAYPENDASLTRSLHEYSGKQMAGSGGADSTFAQQFAAQHLFPLIQDEHGHARDFATIKKNLRNVHVLTHSYGAAFIQQVGNALVNRFETLGFMPDDIHDATSQVVVVAAGPTAPMGAGKASFTTINIVNVHDSEITNLYPVRNMIADMLAASPQSGSPLLVNETNQPVTRYSPLTRTERLKAGKEFFAKPLNIIPLHLNRNPTQPTFAVAPQSHEYIVSSSPPLWRNGIGKMIERPTFNPYGVAAELNAVEGTQNFLGKDETSHQPPVYFHYNFDQNGRFTQQGFMPRTIMSSVLINSMNNAIENSTRSKEDFIPLPNPTKLLKLPQSTKYETAGDMNFFRMKALGYDDNIEAAFIHSSPGLVNAQNPLP